jgi:hypothetical protein
MYSLSWNRTDGSASTERLLDAPALALALGVVSRSPACGADTNRQWPQADFVLQDDDDDEDAEDDLDEDDLDDELDEDDEGDEDDDQDEDDEDDDDFDDDETVDEEE